MENSNPTGQIRLILTKESFEALDQSGNRLIPTISITVPFLATVYTISVFDLRQVHLFSKNYPIVRAQCGLKRWSTHVSTNFLILERIFSFFFLNKLFFKKLKKK